MEDLSAAGVILILLFVIILVIGGVVVNAQTAKTETLTDVIDGDTVYISGLGRCRLARIDAPERGEIGAHESAATLERILVEADNIDVEVKDRGMYGRPIVEMEADGVNVSDEMLKYGGAEPRHE